MRFIISYKGIKRALETPFAMCIGANDLEYLIRELEAQRRGLGESPYGWIRIDPSHPSDCAPNTRPLEWTEASNINPPSSLGHGHSIKTSIGDPVNYFDPHQTDRD